MNLKSIIISFIFFCFSLFSFCQTDNKADGLSQKASNAYQANNISLSLALYKQLHFKYPTYRKLFTLNNLAKCYMVKGNFEKAIQCYNKCIYTNDKTEIHNSYLKNRACTAIAEHYFDQKNYEAAIKYYNFSKKYRATFSSCGIGGLERNMMFAYQKAQCFYELKKYDSVINLLGGTAFISFKDLTLDSSEYEDFAVLYTNAIFKMYGKALANKMLDDGIKNAIFKVIKDTNTTNNVYTITTCKINFANSIIELNYNGWQVELIDNKLPEYFTKAFLINDFKQSSAYQIINNMNKLPISKLKFIEINNTTAFTF